MTPKLKNFSPKVPNHIKLSVDVEVRNDVYNGFRVFLENNFFFKIEKFDHTKETKTIQIFIQMLFSEALN